MENVEIKHWVYIVECCDKTLYCGYTNNIEKRLAVHNSGKGAKYTRGRLPVTLLYCQAFFSKGEALSKEYAIKKMSKDKKLELCRTRRNYE